MPKKLRQKLQKMVGDGLVEVARGEREKQQPGMFSPYKNLVGVAMGPDGNLNEAYLSNDRNNFAPGYMVERPPFGKTITISGSFPIRMPSCSTLAEYTLRVSFPPAPCR